MVSLRTFEPAQCAKLLRNLRVRMHTTGNLIVTHLHCHALLRRAASHVRSMGRQQASHFVPAPTNHMSLHRLTPTNLLNIEIEIKVSSWTSADSNLFRGEKKRLLQFRRFSVEWHVCSGAHTLDLQGRRWPEPHLLRTMYTYMPVSQCDMHAVYVDIDMISIATMIHAYKQICTRILRNIYTYDERSSYMRSRERGHSNDNNWLPGDLMEPKRRPGRHSWDCIQRSFDGRRALRLPLWVRRFAHDSP